MGWSGESYISSVWCHYLHTLSIMESLRCRGKYQGPDSCACELWSHSGLHIQKNLVFNLMLPYAILIFLINLSLKLCFVSCSQVGQWDMHVTIRNTCDMHVCHHFSLCVYSIYNVPKHRIPVDLLCVGVQQVMSKEDFVSQRDHVFHAHKNFFF